ERHRRSARQRGAIRRRVRQGRPPPAAGQVGGRRCLHGRPAEPLRPARPVRGGRARHPKRRRCRHPGRAAKPCHQPASARHPGGHPPPPHRVRDAHLHRRAVLVDDRGRDRREAVLDRRGLRRPRLRPSAGHRPHPCRVGDPRQGLCPWLRLRRHDWWPARSRL
ncbi:MAG: Carbonic anhydrase, beta class, partial [uncultured Nocardioidaceae bacterium]